MIVSSQPQPDIPSTHLIVKYQSPATRLVVYRALQQRWYRLVDALIRPDSTIDELLFCLKELEIACHMTKLGLPPVEIEGSAEGETP